MLAQLSRHGGLALDVRARGDLEVDAHHTVEDVGIAIGEALREALGDKAGLARYGHAVVPLDEALVEAVIDLSGRPHLTFNAKLPSGKKFIGGYDVDLTQDFLQALCNHARDLRPRQRALRPQPPPRRRGHLQGGGPRAARRHGARGDGAAVDQGRPVTAEAGPWRSSTTAPATCARWRTRCARWAAGWW